MKPKLTFLFIAVAAMSLSAMVSCERKVTNEITKIVTPADAEYVGSPTCGSAGCHEETFNAFMNSGHPYKLNEAEDVQQAGYYPYTTVPTPPPGVSWADVDKVIGGFRWKARFIDHDGYIITGDEVQYNLATQEWVPYHSGEVKPYDCGPCHMTGYKDVGNQEGKPGLIGTWAFNGIQCEECHGPGSLHAENPRQVAMKIDRSAEACGKCHIRGDVNEIPASGGFVRHHEQWNEMFTTKHQSLKCVDCHEPHYGLHELNPERDMAIKLKCENCHFDELASFNKTSITEHLTNPNGPDCIDCHMPKAAKSAVGDLATFTGDVRSHMFRINDDPNAEMFSPDGKLANGYLTLEYTCLTCHTDKDKGWAGANVSRVHVRESGAEETCFSCHSDQDIFLVAAELEWENSKHASGENTNRNRLDQPFYQACEKCHTHEGFLARPEVTGVPATGDQFTVIGCFTCHAPHTNGNFNLRITAPVDLANGFTYDKGPSNICSSCHQSRRNSTTYVVDNVTLSTHWGPHHNPQSDMLSGTNGYEYAGFTYSSSAHTNVTTEGCIDCHMAGENNIFTGGHSFNMHDPDKGFENDFGCNVTNCHNGAISGLNPLADADFDGDLVIEGVQDEIDGLLDSLKTILVTAGIVDTAGVPISQTVAAADTAGALWNYLFVEEDRSEGVHNTDYAVDLLVSAINYMNTGNPNGSPGISMQGTAIGRSR